MKTILLVEKNRTELDALKSIFKPLRKEIKILTAMDESVALQLIINHPVDIILCALKIPGTNEYQTLSLLIGQYPHVPLIAIGDKGVDKARELHLLGGYHYHERPLYSALLLDQVQELLEATTNGSVKGILIHSFLQMLEGDAITCTLQCTSRGNIGYIYMSNGELIDAKLGPLSHEEAIYAMIAWDDPIIRVRYYNGKRKNKIRKPLMSIIMEGMRLKDEKIKESDGPKEEGNKRPPFKRFLTAGHRLSLDIGSQVTVDFENIDSPLNTTLVGMTAKSFLIVTTPEHFALTGITLEKNKGLMVKYLDMGKLCLFKSEILRIIHHPGNLLFLSYPSLIHYHELRKARRVSILIPCTLSLENNTQFQGSLIDLSYAGGLCQMQTKDAEALPDVQIEENVILRCLLPGLQEEQEIHGIVKNISKNSQEARIGIAFQNLRSSLQNTINHYLDSVELIHT